MNLIDNYYKGIVGYLVMQGHLGCHLVMQGHCGMSSSYARAFWDIILLCKGILGYLLVM